MPSMDMLRRFVGEDPEADTQVLELCLNAAQQWYEKAGVPAQETDLYRFWVCNLAAWYYDNRGAGVRVRSYGPDEYETTTGYHHIAATCEWVEKIM